MARKATVERAAQRALVADEAARRRAGRTTDSFVNFAAKLGIDAGANNLAASGTYGFNPITRQRNLLDWIHRGSWIGGMAIDIPADDMTRAGVQLDGQLPPDDIEALEESDDTLGIWNSLNDVLKWSRLYGGAIGVLLIDGQNPESPLRADRIEKGAFRGILALDRWMVQPSLNDLITDYGPDLGLPKFYETVSYQGVPKMRVHHSRCMRFEGIRLPRQQRLTEQLWGISVLERLYDRLLAFDSATQGAAQLVYKAHLQTFSIDKMREIVAGNKKGLENLTKYVELMRLFRSIEGMSIIDAKDKMEESGASGAFSGLSDLLLQFGQQLGGALQVPMVRFFGQSPAGLNSDGESALRTYYDGINQKQNRELRVPITVVRRVQAMSLGITLPAGFKTKFRSLWQLKEDEKATIAETTGRAVSAALSDGLLSPQGAMKELRQSSHTTGIFSNITDEDIEAAETEPPPSAAELAQQSQEQEPAGEPGEPGTPPGSTGPTGPAKKKGNGAAAEA